MLVPWRVFTAPSKSYLPPDTDDMIPDTFFFLCNGPHPSDICDIGSFEAVGKRRAIGMRPGEALMHMGIRTLLNGGGASTGWLDAGFPCECA